MAFHPTSAPFWLSHLSQLIDGILRMHIEFLVIFFFLLKLTTNAVVSVPRISPRERVDSWFLSQNGNF